MRSPIRCCSIVSLVLEVSEARLCTPHSRLNLSHKGCVLSRGQKRCGGFLCICGRTALNPTYNEELSRREDASLRNGEGHARKFLGVMWISEDHRCRVPQGSQQKQASFRSVVQRPASRYAPEVKENGLYKEWLPKVHTNTPNPWKPYVHVTHSWWLDQR